jgi:hypothetical protein
MPRPSQDAARVLFQPAAPNLNDPRSTQPGHSRVRTSAAFSFYAKLNIASGDQVWHFAAKE